MNSFSTSIKNLSTTLEVVDQQKLKSQSEIAIAGTKDDKLKFICDNKQIIFKAIDLAKIFTGEKGDKLLDTLKSVIDSICA